MMERINQFWKVVATIWLLISVVTSLETLNCPKTIEWTSYHGSCLKLDVIAADWRQASSECLNSNGRLMNITGNDEHFYKMLRESNGGDNKDAQGEFWIGAHVPPLVHNSYFDRCSSGILWRHKRCFQITDENMSWDDAKRNCAKEGGHLVTVANDATLSFIMKILQSTKHVDSSDSSLKSYLWIDGSYKKSTLVDRNDRMVNFTDFRSDVPYGKNLCLSVVTNSDSRQDLINCDALHPSICEYSLEPQTEHFSISTVHESPSYVGSCDEIAVLSTLATEILSKSIKTKRNRERELLEIYSHIRNGYYILLPTSAILSPVNVPRQQSGAINLEDYYRLEYCDFERANAILKNTDRKKLLEIYLRMYKWSNYESKGKINKRSVGNVASYNQLNVQPNFTFAGACILSDLQGLWKTASCSRNVAYVCQYFPQEAWKIFKRKYPNELEILKAYLDDQLLRLNQPTPTLSPHQVVTDLVDTLEDFCLSTKQHPKMWAAFKFNDLYRLLMLAMKIMDDIQLLSNHTNVQPWVKIKHVDQFIFIQSISTIAEILANSYIKEFDQLESDDVNTSKMASILFNVNKVDGRIVLDFYSHTSEIKMHILHTNQVEKYKKEVSSYQSQHINEKAKIQVKFNENTLKKKNGSIVAFIYATYSTFDIPFSRGHLDMKSDEKNMKKEEKLKRNHMKRTWSFFEENQVSWLAATPVISATLVTSEQDKISLLASYELPITKTEEQSHLSQIDDSQLCSFLKYEGSRRYWSNHGCWLTPPQDIKDNSSRYDTSNKYKCTCNHTTDFAILLLFQQVNAAFAENRKQLFYFGLLGEILSVLSLLVTIITYSTLKRKFRNDRIVVHLNLMTALILAHITLLTTQIAWLGFDGGLGSTVCDIFTFLLHFALLSSMCWMFVEGIILYKKILVVLSRDLDQPKKIYYFLGWIVPVLVSLITVITVKLLRYKYSSPRCWLVTENGLIWSFTGPVCLVLSFNCLIVFKVMVVVVETQRRRITASFTSTQKSFSPNTEVKRNILTVTRGVLVLTPLLGVPWLFGLFSNYSVIAAYLFVGFSSYQGLHIMLFYLILNPEVRAAWGEKRRETKRLKIQDPFVLKSQKQDTNKFANWLKHINLYKKVRHWFFSIYNPIVTVMKNRRILSSANSSTNCESNSLSDQMPPTVATKEEEQKGRSVYKHWRLTTSNIVHPTQLTINNQTPNDNDEMIKSVVMTSSRKDSTCEDSPQIACHVHSCEQVAGGDTGKTSGDSEHIRRNQISQSDLDIELITGDEVTDGEPVSISRESSSLSSIFKLPRESIAEEVTTEDPPATVAVATTEAAAEDNKKRPNTCRRRRRNKQNAIININARIYSVKKRRKFISNTRSSQLSEGKTKMNRREKSVILREGKGRVKGWDQQDPPTSGSRVVISWQDEERKMKGRSGEEDKIPVEDDHVIDMKRPVSSESRDSGISMSN